MEIISIVTVCLNASNTIKSLIDSVACQDYSHYKLYIIDGGSTDQTIDIVNSYNLENIYCISEKDNGIYDAMNKAINLVKGKWVIFLGADDILYNSATLSSVSKYLKGDQFVYYGNAYFKNRQKIYDKKFGKYKLCLRNISHQAIFYPIDALRKYKYNTNYPLLADYHLNLLLYGDNNYKFSYIECIVSVYDDSGSSSSIKDTAFEKIKLELVKHKLGYIPWLYAFVRRRLKEIVLPNE